jgi:hypothetical protein
MTTLDPPADEWYPRECEFCTGEAALACPDSLCRQMGFGEPHKWGCPAAQTKLIIDCTCTAAVTQ